jgi:uncharacterized protein YrrD
MATTITRSPISASTLTGDDIRNHQDETLGSVHDIMIDCDSGRVAYVVMSSGGFLGMGNKLFAIPITAMTLDRDNHCLRMDASKKTFENAEGFDKDHWPDMADPRWESQVHRSFNTHPWWENPTA